MRYPALQGKRDANEPGIISALESAGCSVEQLPTGRGVPDLLCGVKRFMVNATDPVDQSTYRLYRYDNYLLEVKTDTGKLNPKQVKWHSDWQGQVAVVHSADEALAACGLGGIGGQSPRELRTKGLL